jgi:hypothetical protein
MDQIFVDCKFIVFNSLVRKDDLISNLGAVIFIICERFVDENE